MPSQILHTLFGEDVIAEIYRSIDPRFGLAAHKAREKILGCYRDVFALGCQGPDLFYHNQRSRPVGLEYGTLLHRRGYGIFTAGLLKMGLPDPPPDEEDIRLGRREKGINALGVYALGFMSHPILDRAAHPYIVYKSGFVSPKRPETGKYARFHAFFERIIDTLMLEKLRGIQVSRWDQGILAGACEKPPLGLKELLARALVLAYPERAGKDEKLHLRINNTFLDCAGFYRLTAPDKTALGRFPGEIDPEFLALLYPEDLPGDVDFLNLEKRPWYYPLAEGKEDSRSFPEIYAHALKAASDALSPVIIRYLETGIFPIREAAQAIGNGGLSIRNREGKPCAPTRSDPLPLERVLRREALRRGIRAGAG